MLTTNQGSISIQKEKVAQQSSPKLASQYKIEIMAIYAKELISKNNVES